MKRAPSKIKHGARGCRHVPPTSYGNLIQSGPENFSDERGTQRKQPMQKLYVCKRGNSGSSKLLVNPSCAEVVQIYVARYCESRRNVIRNWVRSFSRRWKPPRKSKTPT